nr:NADH dehydrogenase subunit 3 [Didemnum perlucidum]
MFMIFFFMFLLFFLGMMNLKGTIFMDNNNKFKTYECGYKGMGSSKNMYSSQFFVLALSFMLFDLEIVFFMPYFIIFYYSNLVVYLLLFFLIFLLFGLYFELIQKII